MLDDSSNDRVPSEGLSHEICFLDNEELQVNKVEHYYNEYPGQYWLEKFRRALKEDDQRSQRELQKTFSIIISNWIHDHPKSGIACKLHTEEYYINETFRCFWQTLLKQQKFDLVCMADVLSYLHVIMNGVILDTIRYYSSPQVAPLSNTVLAEEVNSCENDSTHEIWGLIESKFSNARERRMVHLLFQCHLKPGEIVDRFPNEFSDANEISRIRRNIVEILTHGDQNYSAMNRIS
jgi:hypothetical protein